MTPQANAILGCLLGTAVGDAVGLACEGLSALWEWPRTVTWMERLAAQLAEVGASGVPQRPLALPVLPLMLRNVFFAGVILTHGFRRLLPPY